jgi:hypothetical protein
VGRFDLLFIDKFGTNVLMELKAVTAKYENATQLAKYKEALDAKGEQNILMWLVAPAIPTSVREFLDRIGIEYSEIHEAQLRRVADHRGLEMETPRLQVPNSDRDQTRAKRQALGGDEIFGAKYTLLPTIDKEKIERLVKQFESVVKRRIDKSLATKLREDILDSDPPFLRRATLLQLARWCKTDGIYSEGMVVAQRISEALIGLVVDRKRLGT